MKEKIEWYQEVLELEPGSKVFFPLARLLGQTGEVEEAMRILRQGLARHPEYIEARLLLVQLLQESGSSAQCAKELTEIIDIFAQYPGFWAAWSEHSPTDDVACALGFLSATFRCPGLSLRGVFEAGLRELNDAESLPRAPAQKGKQAKPAGRPVAAPMPEPAALAQTRPEPVDALESPSLPVSPEEHDEPSVRTRTMAEILAEQGDIQGAVDIYNEILANTIADDEADKLLERLADLTARLGLAAEPAQAVKDPANVEPEEAAASALEVPELPGQASTAQSPMRGMLEKLAKRLEARAEA